MSKKVWNSCKNSVIASIAKQSSPAKTRLLHPLKQALYPRKDAWLLIFLLSMSVSFAQTTQQKKSDGSAPPPSITMPEMPSVSMPSVGSEIYGPGRKDFYTGTNPNQNRNQAKSSQNGSSDSTKVNSQGAKGSDSLTNGSSSSSAQNQNAIVNAQKLNTLAKSSSSALNQLTADDISSMSNLGAFSQLSSLLGRKNSNLQEQLLSAQNTVTASTKDSEALKQILSELSELKNKINAEDEKKTQNAPDISGNAPKNKEISLNDKSFGKDSFSSPIKKEPKILRFIVNGYDILATCKKIYFSDAENDGTFLLTGDRKYMSENKVRSETFYFFFKTNGSDGGITKYAVTPAVSQDYQNEYSYLYQLTQKQELSANRTGNLVTLRVSDNDWKMDLLISLDR